MVFGHLVVMQSVLFGRLMVGGDSQLRDTTDFIVYVSPFSKKYLFVADSCKDQRAQY